MINATFLILSNSWDFGINILRGIGTDEGRQLSGIPQIAGRGAGDVEDGNGHADGGSDILGPVFVAGAETFFLGVGFDIDDVVGLEIVNFGVEKTFLGHVDCYGHSDAVFLTEYGDAGAEAVDGDIATHGDGFEDGEAVAGDMEFLGEGDFADNRDSEIHGGDGDDGVEKVSFVDESGFDMAA